MKKKLKKNVLTIILVLTLVVTMFSSLSVTANAATNYSAVFNATYYSNKYPDLKAAFGTNETKLLNHFINNGMKEGRQGSEEFNVQAYKARYADLRAAFGNNLPAYYMHYINNGKAEGRNGRADGTTTTTTTTTTTPAPTGNTPTASNPITNGACPTAVNASAQSWLTKTVTYDDYWEMRPVYDIRGNIIQYNPYHVTGNANEVAAANANPSGLRSGSNSWMGTVSVGDVKAMYYQGTGEIYNMECYAISKNGFPLFRAVGSKNNITSDSTLLGYIENYCTTNMSKAQIRNSLNACYSTAGYGNRNNQCMTVSSDFNYMFTSLGMEAYTFIGPDHQETFAYYDGLYENKTLTEIYNASAGPNHPLYLRLEWAGPSGTY